MMPELIAPHADDLEWYQMLVRAVIVFVVAILFIRLAGIRSFGTGAAFDVVISITLGALLSRCITGHYPFYETLAAALFLAAMHRFFACLSFKSKFVGRIMEGDAVPLYRNGKLIHKYLRQHNITDNDLLKALHEAGLDDLRMAKTIWLEPDGRISIVKLE
ncbi:MAG: DUF421 domain-containing protein [Bacteroidia bacterium]